MLLAFGYAILVAIILPIPIEIALVKPLADQNFGFLLGTGLAIAAGKTLGAWLIFIFGLNIEGSIRKWSARWRVADWTVRKAENLVQKTGYAGLYLLLSIPLMSDTIPIYVYSVFNQEGKALERTMFLIAGQTIESTLRGIVKGFPSLDRLPPFYRELVDILVDANQLKKHLGAIDWAADRTANMARDYRRRIGKSEGHSIGELRKQAYGRLSSLVEQVGPDLEALTEARRALRRLPEIDPALRTVVVAGYPNVGKSSFVRAVSSGRPKIADYPFTTKRVSIGHFDRGVERFQILDTPGLLDRPMGKRK